MKRLYQTTFDQIKLSEEQTQRLRSRLQAGSAQKEEKKVIPMKRKFGKLTVVAAVLVLALACMACAYGEQFYYQCTMLAGGRFEDGIGEDGNRHGEISIAKAPYLVEDGRVYLTLNGQHEDITDRCSETDYIAYEKEEKNGVWQLLVIGGTPDDMGYWNFVVVPSDGNGDAGDGSGGSGSVDPEALWFQKACEDYDIDPAIR